MALKSDYSGLRSKGERESGGVMSYARQCRLKYEAIKSNLEISMSARWQRLIWCSTVNPLWVNVNSAGSSVGKESTCNTGDPGSIPGLGRSPGEGGGYPLWYSDLENFRDCIIHGVTKSRHNWATFTFFPNYVRTICLFLSFSIILLWAKLLSLS